MKKITALLLTSVMVISCAACGKQEAAPTPTVAPTQAPVATEAPSNTGVNAAKDYLYAMYKDGQNKPTTSDFDVVGVVKVSGVTYNVDWTVNADAVKVGAMDASTKKVTVSVDAKTPTQVDYTLTATVKDDKGNTASTSFNYYIPAYTQFSWAQYVAAEKGETVVVSGVVTGIIAASKGATSNSIYFQDKDGAYYAYGTSSAADPIADLGIKEGMTIEVTGTRDTYSGTYEIANYSVEITDSSIKTVEAANYTDLFLNASSLKDEKLTANQSALVYLEGVEILGVSPTDATYYLFQLGDKQSYVRISGSSCPLTKDEQEAFKTSFNEHKGYLADVKGILTLYDGAFYITPLTVDCIYNLRLAEKTDAEKVEYEAANLGIPAKVNQDTVVALLPAGQTYSDVAVSYTVEGEAAVYDAAAGTLTITQGDKDAVVKVTAVVTVGSETKTVETEIAVEAKASDLCEAAVLAKAAALAEGEAMSGTQVLRGEIVEIPTAYNEQYNNVTVNIKIGETVIQCFRLIGGAELQVGDVITVTGNIKNYKGTVEFDAKCTYSKDLTVEQAKQLIVLDKAFALAEGEVMPGTQVLSGTITKFDEKGAYSEEYDNCSIWMQVGDKEIEAYRLKGGKDLKVGDVVTVTGTLKNYKGTVEFDKGCTYLVGEQLSAAKDLLAAAKAFELAEGESMSYMEELTGEIVEIPTAYNEQYDNVTVNIKVGEYIIQCFRLIGGSELKVGDVITVTGTLKNYKGTVEFDSKCTYVK